jgi:nucleotide-binding universal stress UspA family protein
MNEPKARPPIVVGIDGSDAAIRAARWAVDAAVSRNLPLRLIYVIEPGSEAVRLEVEYAGIALREARGAVTTSGQHVEVETAVRRGEIDAVLAQESRSAEMICIGTGNVDDDFDDFVDWPAGTTLPHWPARLGVRLWSSARPKSGLPLYPLVSQW